MAQSLMGIILARGLQGMAAGLMIPLSLSLIFSAYPTDQRGRASGIWGFAVMIAPAIGPSVGGLLLEISHWRALFLMNMPFALLGLFCAYRYLSSESANRRNWSAWDASRISDYGARTPSRMLVPSAKLWSMPM